MTVEHEVVTLDIRLCLLEHNSLVYRLYSTYLISHLLITITNFLNVFFLAIVFWIFQMIKLWGGGQNLERPIFRSFEISSIKTMSYSIFYFRIYFLFLYLFKLFEHPKYIIIYNIVNLGNFNNFSNCSILKICYCSKLNNFRNLFFFFKLKNLGNF